MNFRSDNEGYVAEPIIQAILDANRGTASAYSEDKWSEQLNAAFSAVFAIDVQVLPLTTGTAANSIALATMCPGWGSVVCHADAHIEQDECGAPEFFNPGSKLVGLPGAQGKLQVDTVSDWLGGQGAHGVHQHLPSVLSLTQATEAGTVYSVAEVADLAAVAKSNDMYVHMDGARFANAIAHLGCEPADITWRAGIDALSFGAAKNGCMAAEALVVFGHPEWLPEMERRRKQSGHLISKMRYISAQLLAYLDDDCWLDLATTANHHAQRFAKAIQAHPTAELATPVQANEVFLQWPRDRLQQLKDADFDFHFWPGSDNLARLVFACTTSPEDVTRLIESLQKIQ